MDYDEENEGNEEEPAAAIGDETSLSKKID